jgi:hypothetical protein
MNRRKFTKYIVIVLAILLAELLHAYAHSLLQDWKDNASPYQSVIVSMMIAVLVFYPAFHFIGRYKKYASEKYTAGTKRLTKNRFTGLMLGFAAALFLLFVAFSGVWYQKNPVADLKVWIESTF